MLFVSKVKSEDEIEVCDSEDWVVETYSLAQLKEIIASTGIRIEGVHNNTVIPYLQVLEIKAGLTNGGSSDFVPKDCYDGFYKGYFTKYGVVKTDSGKYYCIDFWYMNEDTTFSDSIGHILDYLKSYSGDGSDIIEIYIHSWNCENSNKFNGFFANLPKLKYVYIASSEDFPASGGVNLDGMFENCKSLEDVNFSHWALKAVVGTQGMFSGCKRLKKFDIAKQFSQLTWVRISDFSKMFYGCTALEEVNLSHWGIESVTDLQGMFQGCKNLKSFDITKQFPQSACKNITDVSKMFYGCTALEEVNLSGCGFTFGFGADSIPFTSMFNGCTSLKRVDFSNNTTEKPTFGSVYRCLNFSQMFKDCVNLEEVNFAGAYMGVRLTTRVKGMFVNCHKLTQVNFDSLFNGLKVYFETLFSQCENLKKIAVTISPACLSLSIKSLIMNCKSLESIEFVIPANLKSKLLKRLADIPDLDKKLTIRTYGNR